jgi:hypothetical protein
MQTDVQTFLNLQKQVLQINENNFDEIAWQIFKFQAEHNRVYRDYLKALQFDPSGISKLEEIPFLPIQLFKTHTVKTGNWPTQRIYKSSGTTQETRSMHHLWDEEFYLIHAAKTFEHFFGAISNYHVLCLLPSYDTVYSSLVAMARYFVAKSGSLQSGFFLENLESIPSKIQSLANSNRKILLIGVSHALLDLAEKGPFSFGDTLVMETGGMKGRKQEITRAELHQQLKDGLGKNQIISEYGMTELLSQAYSQQKGIFEYSDSMRVIIKEISDPFKAARSTGIINIIDLANLHSCSFIETQDLGRVTENGFEVLGRVDNSEVRGCNLLLA